MAAKEDKKSLEGRKGPKAKLSGAGTTKKNWGKKGVL